MTPLAVAADSYADWSTSFDLSGAEANISANPDGDAFPNGVEYLLNLNPLVPNVSSENGPILSRTDAGLTLRWVERNDPSPEPTVQVQRRDPLAARWVASDSTEVRVPLISSDETLVSHEMSPAGATELYRMEVAYPRVADLDQYIPATMARWKLPGLAIAVVKGDEVVLAKGYGQRRAGDSTPVDANTLFAIGSTTKAFTVAANGILVEQGVFDWDSHVVDFWPGFEMSDPWVTDEIRVSDLMANHSGLSVLSEALWYGTDLTREQIIARLAVVPIDEGFRYRFQYRNTMFLAAGQLIGQASETTWDELIQNRIFAPLGMSQTFPTDAGLIGQQNVARPHVIDYAGEPLPINYREMNNIAPAGSIISNITDMAKWVQMWANNGNFNGETILEPETVEYISLSQTPLPTGGPPGHQPVPKVELPAYALGWVTESYQGQRVVWHNGGIDGMSAWVGFVPESKLGVAILSNLDNCDARRAIFYRVLDWYAGRELSDLAPALAERYAMQTAARDELEQTWQSLSEMPVAPPLPLSAYTGNYAHPVFGDVHIRSNPADPNSLVYERTSQHVLILRHQENNTFLGKFTDQAEDLRSGKDVVVFSEEGGEIIGFMDEGFDFQRD